jgi:hypothetical protein
MNPVLDVQFAYVPNPGREEEIAPQPKDVSTPNWLNHGTKILNHYKDEVCCEKP